MQHYSSTQFQKKIASGVEVVREESNNKPGDKNLVAVEFSDGAVGLFGNGDPEWLGSWAEATALLEQN